MKFHFHVDTIMNESANLSIKMEKVVTHPEENVERTEIRPKFDKFEYNLGQIKGASVEIDSPMGDVMSKLYNAAMDHKLKCRAERTQMEKGIESKQKKIDELMDEYRRIQKMIGELK